MERPGCTCLPVPTLLVVTALWCAATIAPLALWQWSPPLIDSSYGGGHQPFELLGMFLSLGALLVAAWHVRRIDGAEPQSWVVAMLWLLPVLAVIQQVSEYAQPSWDWKCYVGAADALRAGLSPYTDCYLYPPLVAQLFAGAYPGFHWLGETLAMMAPKHWMVVFFFWHSFQVLMVAFSMLLLTRLAQREGMSRLVAVGVVAALLLVDTPLQRTIRHNQVNLIVLNVMLLASDRIGSRSSVAGLLVAMAAHIKLLPAILIGVLGLQRRWVAVSVAVCSAVGLAAVQQWGMTPAGMWTQFFDHAPQFVQGEYFRDNSPTGLMFNLIRVPVDLLGGDIRGWAVPLRGVGLLASVGLAAWVVQGMRTKPDDDRLWAEGMAVMLLMSPVTWEHHYVWALPIAVVAVARCWEHHPMRIGSALILIFGLPTFDVFPLSYHRLMGLIILFASVRGSARAVNSGD